jgi:hypothetical protein
MTQQAEPARLIAASLLLDDAKYGPIAANQLKSLGTSPDRRIQQLAKAQLWRNELNSTDLSRYELDRWEERIDAMPEDLRGGPYFLLGRGFLLRQEYDKAAAAFLWLPLVYDHDQQLAARAAVAAANALVRVGEKTEAATIYREVVVRFPKTDSAPEAAAQWKALTAGNSSGQTGAAPPTTPAAQQ